MLEPSCGQTLAKHMILLKDATFNEILAFLVCPPNPNPSPNPNAAAAAAAAALCSRAPRVLVPPLRARSQDAVDLHGKSIPTKVQDHPDKPVDTARANVSVESRILKKMFLRLRC